MRLLLTAVVIAFACCQASPEAPGPEDPTVLVPPTEPAGPAGAVALVPPEEKGPSLRLKAMRFTRGALRLTIADHPHRLHLWDEGGVLIQTVPLGDDRELEIVVRAGRGETLEGFRRDHQHTELSDEESTRVCGRLAKRQLARRAEEHITCIEYADGRPSSPGYIPAETKVAVAFEHRGLGVTAVWEIPTELREQYRDLEERFFASIICE